LGVSQLETRFRHQTKSPREGRLQTVCPFFGADSKRCRIEKETRFVELGVGTSLVSIHKWSFCSISVLCSKNNPRNIKHMPAVIFLACLDLEQKSSFMDGHSLGSIFEMEGGQL